jgi:hypothetical protein
LTVSITGTWLDDQAEAQRLSFQRALMVSVLLHSAAVAVLAFAPEPVPLRQLEVVSVKLVSLPAIPSAEKRAAPVPAPAQKKIILPKEAPAVVKKRRPKPKPLEYSDALAALRSELGEPTPVPLADPKPALGAQSDVPSAPEAPGQDAKLAPETIVWMRATKNHLRKVWVVPPEFMHRALRTDLLVALSVSGEVIGTPEIVRSSGDPYWDDNTIRALLRASPLPAPPEAGEWPFIFSPEEAR